MGNGDGARPWYRRPSLIAPLVVAVVGAVGLGAVALGGDGGDPAEIASDSSTTAPGSAEDLLDCAESLPEPAPPPPPQPPSPAPVDEGPQTVRPQQPNRPSSRASDEPSAAGGSETTASTLVEDAASVGEAMCVDAHAVAVTDARVGDGGQVIVSVVIENDADEPGSVNPLDWRLVTENGDVGPASNRRDDALEVGELAPGEQVEATVVFDAGAGAHLVVFQPDPTDDAAIGAWSLEG